MSFWSAPLGTDCRWPTYRSFLMSWVLSTNLAKQHYRTVLVTDAIFAEVSRELQLPFIMIDECLDTQLNKLNYQLWCSPKFVGIDRHAVDSFVHLDEDVYLWNPLPERLFNERVFGQNKEDLADFFYNYRAFTSSLQVKPAGWAQYRSSYAINGGILGGSDVAFWRLFIRSHWELIGNMRCSRQPEMFITDQVAVMAEQYFLAWFCQRQNVPVGFLLEETDGKAEITEKGYTHLIGHAKRMPEVLGRLEQRVQADYPEFVERVDKGVRMLRKRFPKSRTR